MTASAHPLTFTNAGKKFGDQWAVDDLTLELAEGTILGLIGPSGCGKTTSVRLANGVYRPDSGNVRVFGSPPHSLDAADRARIGYLPQQPVLFSELSLWENLNFHAAINGVTMRRRDWLHELLELVDLEGEEKKLVREASGGMQRRLALAGAMVHSPPLLMLDEPTAGIDPILRRRFWEHFRALSVAGRTLVITTQYVGEAADCDVVGLLADGSLIALGTPESLRRQAMGGDVIEIEISRPYDGTMLESFQRQPGVVSGGLASSRRVRLVVDDSGARLPVLAAWLDDNGAEIVDSEVVAVSYDDVFIELVERSQASSHAGSERPPSSEQPSVGQGLA